MIDEEEDEWLTESPSLSGSLFEKKIINFTNDIIEQKIEKVMEQPILNKPIDDYDDET